MATTGLHAPRSRGRRALAAVAILLPAALAMPAILDLARAGWVGGAPGRDPLVERLAPPAAPLPERLDHAAALAGRDFRYRFWRGETILAGEDAAAGEGFARWGRAAEELARAAGLAPTVGEVRLALSAALARLGRLGDADEQAWAALRLAPLRKDVARRVARWFADRYLATREDEHLARHLAAARAAHEPVGRILGAPSLGSADVARIFDAGGFPPAERIAMLVEAGRFEEALAAAGADQVARGDVLARRGLAHLAARRAGHAAADLAEAADLLGEEFGEHLALARALLSAGSDAPEAFAALAAALDHGAGPEEARAALAAARVPPARRVEFWEERIRGGDSGPEIRLELGQALADAGRAGEAEAALAALADGGPAAAEANHLLARLSMKAGRLASARMYAERAIELSGGDARHRQLLDSLPELPR